MQQLKILQKLYSIFVENIQIWPKSFYFCNQRADIQFAQEDERSVWFIFNLQIVKKKPEKGKR